MSGLATVEDRIDLIAGAFWRSQPLPGEISHPPRSWTEAAYNVVRWSTPARGGHFAAMEAPDEFVEDVRTFFAELSA